MRRARLALCFAVADRALSAALCAQTHLVIVSGLGGEKKYTRRRSRKISQALADAANKRFGIPDAEIHVVRRGQRVEEAALSRAVDEGQRRARDDADRARARARAIRSCIVLIGHGSGDGRETKISIPGPDLSARDFAQLLARFPTQKVAFVNLTSASGDMLPVLVGAESRRSSRRPRAAFERNESHFAQYFVDALTKDVADTDKDGRVSLLEAFRYAVVETKRLYENDTRLQTEHAQLDDMGAKAGVDATRTAEPAQGVLARRFFLDGGVRDARRRERSAARRAVQGQVRARGPDRSAARRRRRR